MIHKILVPSGIGDFSWTWSKFVTTGDQYHIEYAGGEPDRMKAYLNLLSKDKILSFGPNSQYHTMWNKHVKPIELICKSRNPSVYSNRTKMVKYCQLNNGASTFVESNTFLEDGNRLELWLKDEIPTTDFHYKIEGALTKSTKANYFIVNFSSYGTKKAWGYYDVSISADVVQDIVKKTNWIPVFVGGYYDDYTNDIHVELLKRNIQAISLVGRTPDLLCVIALLQQSKMYFGACSGLMVLANVLYTPVCCYYPPFNEPPGRKLAGTWHDPNIPYLSLFWEGKETDIEKMQQFLKDIK